MNQDKFEHSALEDVYQALDLIEQCERMKKQAEQTLHQAVLNIPLLTGGNDDLHDDIFHYLYWHQERVKVASLKAAFQRSPRAKGTRLAELMKSTHIELTCSQCQQVYYRQVTSRADLLLAQNFFRSSSVRVCSDCKDKGMAEWSKKHEDRMNERAMHLERLRTMPYREYLQTPEWQERRKRAMKRAGYRCAVCNAYGVKLNVHHRTYERRGNEDDRDLVTLCATCHQIFHDNGTLAIDAK